MATTTTWTGSVNSNWQDAGNWTNGVPTAADTAVFSNNATVEVLSGERVEVQNLVVNSGVEVTKLGPGAILVSPSSFGQSTGSFDVGSGGKFVIAAGSIEAGPAADGATGFVELRDGGNYSYDGVGAFSQDVLLSSGINNALYLGQNVSSFTGEIIGFNAGESIVWSRSGTATNTIDYVNDTVFVTKSGVTLTFQFAEDFTTGQLQVDQYGNITTTRSSGSVPTNSEPVAVADTLSATEDTAVTFQASDLVQNDTDTDGDALAIASVTSGTGGSVALNSDGTVTFTSNANFNGAASFTYTVEDGQGGESAAATVTVNVAAVNDAPVLTGDLQASVNENGSYTLTTSDVGYTDVDDASTGVAFTVSGLSNGRLLVDGVEATTFTSAQLAAGDVVFQQNGSESSTAGFQITVEDGNEDSSTPVASAFTFSVTPINDAPQISSNGGGTTAAVNFRENSTNAVTTVLATDAENNALTFSIAGGADASLFAIDAATGDLSFINAPDFETPADADGDNAYEVVVAASDGSGDDTQAITVTVTDANEAPTITSNGGGETAAITFDENSDGIVATVVATDADANDDVTYRISGGADAALFLINDLTGELTFAQSPNFEGPTDADGDNRYEVSVEAVDGDGATDTQALTIAINDIFEPSRVPSTGPDRLSDTPGDSRLDGGLGNDTISGGAGNDTLIGGAGNDQISASPAAGQSAMVYGGSGEVSPNDGADQISVSGNGSGTVFGNGGDDRIDYTATGAGSIYGGVGGDSITVRNDAANLVVGGTGSGDVITITGNGNNVAYGGSFEADANDGADRLVVNGNGNNRLFGNGGDDEIIVTGSGNNSIYGGVGNDNITGGSGDDLIVGGTGMNFLTGGRGADRFAHEGGDDVILDFSFEDGDQVALGGRSYVLGQNNEGQAALFVDDGSTVVFIGYSQAEFQSNFLA